MNKRQKTTDHDIILQYVGGDRSVLPELVKRYHKHFCEKAYWVTKDKEIAKDVAQECWIIIIDKLHSLKNLDRFQSWAYRIVYTKAIDRLKKRKKEVSNHNTASIPNSDVDFAGDKNAKRMAALLKAIRKLSNDQQDIIRLFYLEEYSIREISGFLNIPKGTVKSRLFKSREKLKSILKNISHEE